MIFPALILVTILLSFFFSGIEMALISVRKTRLRALKARDPHAGIILGILEDPRRMLISILIGNNAAIVLGSLAAEHALTRRYPVAGEWIAFFGMTLVFFILTEILPKNLFRVAPEYFALRLAKLIRLSFQLLRPLEHILEAATGLLFPREENQGGKARSLTREEFLMMVEARADEGVFTRTDTELIASVMSLKSVGVTEVMTPWESIVHPSLKDTPAEILGRCREFRLSGIPVLDNPGTDQVAGMIDVRDLLFAEEPVRDPASVLKPVIHLEDSASLRVILGRLRKKTAYMAVIYHEGRPVGWVTLLHLFRYFK